MTDEVEEVIETNTRRFEGKESTDLGDKSIAELLGKEEDEE